MKSLKAQNNHFSESQYQISVLEENSQFNFKSKLIDIGLFPLRSTGIDILQLNIGKMCNQVCKHCHVDAGPDRKEIMTRETMQHCLDVLKETDISVVDLTGGAPEMNPHFRWLVGEISRLGRKVMVRCNLTIVLANPKYHDLPEFFKNHGVEVVSSLPFYSAMRTNSQRGDGVFEKSVTALQMLNEVGYGRDGSGLILNLVYNPAGAFLPGDQNSLERDFKKELKNRHSIEFNNLFAITNLPISRFLDYLVSSGNYETYMEKLVSSFNPSAAENVMCRNTLSVGWDGYLYDCDFNQMLELKVNEAAPQHIKDFKLAPLQHREIAINQHCFGCTAGAGSSCGGEVT